MVIVLNKLYAFLLPCCLLLIPSIALSQEIAAESTMKVRRIEPPNWWQGMKLNRVQLLLTGSNLDSVSVSSSDPAHLKVLKQHGKNPNYLFVDVEIASNADAKMYQLMLTKHDITTAIDWEIQPRSKAKGQQGFNQSDVVYLITPDRFANGDASNDDAEDKLNEFDPSKDGKRHGGDIAGIIHRLGYLKDLGVTALWLNPVLENRGYNSYHGYKTTDHYRIDPRFGSNEEYRSLVEEAHQHGIKVIFDHIANHIGVKHPWLEQLPTPTWLNGSIENHLLDKHDLHSVADLHADDEARKQLKTFWFVDSMPDLNQRDPYVANYLIQNTLWWIEYSGIDGIREDTWPYADDGFLNDWVDAILNEYPNFNIVGEIWSLQSAHIARYQKGTPLPRSSPANLPSVMDFPLSQALRNFVEDKGKLRDVHAAYSQDFLFGDPKQLMVFVDNHDMTRVFYIADGAQNRAKLAMGIMLLSRGIPQILYGSEIGMRGGESHIELRADFPGGFSNLRPNEPDAFTANGRSKTQQATFEWLRSILTLRKSNSAFTKGSMIHFAPTWQRDVYRFIRMSEDQKVLVIANGEKETLDIDLSDIQRYIDDSQLVDLLTGESFSPKKPVPVDGISLRVLEIRK